MPITRSRTSSEQSTPEVAVSGDGEHKEVAPVATKESLKSATPAPDTKNDTSNGCPRVAPSEEDKTLDEEKKEENVKDGSEAKAAPVAGETDGEAAKEEDLNKETAASQTVEKAADAGKETSEAAEKATNGSVSSKNGVCEGEELETKTTQTNQVEEAAPTGDVCCAKRKTDDSEVSSEADSTCKKNKVDGEAAEPVATH